jgi:hypothetical protein
MKRRTGYIAVGSLLATSLVITFSIFLLADNKSQSTSKRAGKISGYSYSILQGLDDGEIGRSPNSARILVGSEQAIRDEFKQHKYPKNPNYEISEGYYYATDSKSVRMSSTVRLVKTTSGEFSFNLSGPENTLCLIKVSEYYDSRQPAEYRPLSNCLRVNPQASTQLDISELSSGVGSMSCISGSECSEVRLD